MRIIIILVSICIVLAIFVGIVRIGNNYKMSYLSINGVSLGSSREDVFAGFGEPVETTYSECGFFGGMHYEGIIFSFVGFNCTTPPSRVIGIDITTPDIRLGSNQIGIGSTRQEVEKTEWNKWPLRFSARSYFDYAFMVSIKHDSEAIWFYFNQEDIIYRISINFHST